MEDVIHKDDPAGVLGIALAGAGADVVLTDLPHVLPLTQQNVEANLKAYHRARVSSVPTPLLRSDSSQLLPSCSIDILCVPASRRFDVVVRPSGDSTHGASGAWTRASCVWENMSLSLCTCLPLQQFSSILCSWVVPYVPDRLAT